MSTSWTVKHKPGSLREVIGNAEAKEKLSSWVKSWDKGLPKKRAVFIYGSPGIGKTLAVECFSKDFEMELVEKNASDYRTEHKIKRFAGLASQYGSFSGRKRIVLLDELDGLTGNADRGGVRAITEIIKTARWPIVLIANNAYNPKFSNLRKYCLLIEFKNPSSTHVAKYLGRISERERIQADKKALMLMAQRSEGDVRSAINDFQALAQGKPNLTYDDVSWLGYRDRRDTIFNVLKMIIYGRTCLGSRRAVRMADVNINMLFEWIYENIPAHFTDPRDLASGMDSLSKADMYRGRIHITQDWSLTRYVIDYMTSGVTMARKNTKIHGWTPFRFPSRIQMLSRSKTFRAERLRIGKKIKKRFHISASRSYQDVLPYLQVIFKNNPKMAAGVAKWLDLDADMIEYIANNKKKAGTIIKLMN